MGCVNVQNFGNMFDQTRPFNNGGKKSCWDTSSATNMTWMFNQATFFNQDITGWCVPFIGSQPGNFGTNVANQPNWEQHVLGIRQ